MTFTLQDYNQLKKKYYDTKVAVLSKHEKDSIELLKADRREPMKFIEYVIEELDKQIKKQVETPPKKYHHKTIPINQREILTAAMHLMSTVITSRLSLSSLSLDSLLRNRLDTDLEITADNIPGNVISYELYRKLNQFLRIVFNDKDSRNGIDPNNPLRYIDQDTLIIYIKRSYELEEEYYKMAVADLGTAGKELRADSYRVTEPILASTLSDLPNFETLNEELNSLELKEQGKKSVTKIEELSAERVAQLQFLNKLREHLKTIPIKESDKIAILAGAMYIVREQIGRTYSSTREPLSNADNGSVIHTGLTKILNAKTNSPENIQDLVRATLHYMTHATLDGVEQIRSRHIFSDIPGFSVQAVLSLSKNMVKTCRLKALDTAVGAYKIALAEQQTSEKEKTGASASGFTGLLSRVGGFFTSISTPKDPKTTEEALTEINEVVIVKDTDYETIVAKGPQ